SIAVETVLGIGLLSLARFVQQMRIEQPTRDNLRFILRGDFIVVMATGITLVTYLMAIAQNPAPLGKSGWGYVLIGGIGWLSVLAVLAGVAIGQAWRNVKATYPGHAKSSNFVPGMLYEAVNAVLALLWLPVLWLTAKSSLIKAVYRR